MRFDVITLFPELFAPFQRAGVVRRAFDAAQAVCVPWQLRSFASGGYRRVDDRPYGGGPGMVMTYEPLAAALQAIRQARSEGAFSGADTAPVILFSPAGKPLTQSYVTDMARQNHGAILVCGRYEGVDQRFIDHYVDEEISVGDYVLSGGELPALLLMDAVCRLLPGVLGDAQSHQQDSYSDGLLDCPHYSRPESLGAGLPASDVPSVLLGGNHVEVARWRREAALELTLKRRPELIDSARALGGLSLSDEQFLQKIQTLGLAKARQSPMPVSLKRVPVVDERSAPDADAQDQRQ